MGLAPLGRHVGMEELDSAHHPKEIDLLTAPTEEVIEKDTKESAAVYSDASDVSSSDFSGPEDGECESDEEGRKSADFGHKSADLGPNPADFLRQSNFRRLLVPHHPPPASEETDFENRTKT